MTDDDLLDRLVVGDPPRTIEDVEADLHEALIVRRKSIDFATRMKELAVAAGNRTRYLESVLAEIWRWTNTNSTDLVDLMPLLIRADEEYRVVVALNEIARESTQAG